MELIVIALSVVVVVVLVLLVVTVVVILILLLVVVVVMILVMAVEVVTVEVVVTIVDSGFTSYSEVVPLPLYPPVVLTISEVASPPEDVSATVGIFGTVISVGKGGAVTVAMVVPGSSSNVQPMLTRNVFTSFIFAIASFIFSIEVLITFC